MELTPTGFSPQTDAEIKQILRAQQAGGILRDTPEGPVIDTFEPYRLAYAIEQEIERCKKNGWPTITMHMDVIDAALLARFLRLERRP